MHFSLQTSTVAAATKATVSFDELLQKAQSCQLDLTTVLSVELNEIVTANADTVGVPPQLRHHSWERVLSSGSTASGKSQA